LNTLVYQYTEAVLHK